MSDSISLQSAFSACLPCATAQILIMTHVFIRTPADEHTHSHSGSPSCGFEVVIQCTESSLQHLLDGLEEGVVYNMKSFIQWVTG